MNPRSGLALGHFVRRHRFLCLDARVLPAGLRGLLLLLHREPNSQTDDEQATSDDTSIGATATEERVGVGAAGVKMRARGACGVRHLVSPHLLAAPSLALLSALSPPEEPSVVCLQTSEMLGFATNL